MATEQLRTHWLEAMLSIAKHYRIDISKEFVKTNFDSISKKSLEDQLYQIATQIGLSYKEVEFSRSLFDPWRLPIIIEFDNDQVGIIETVDGNGNVSVTFSGEKGSKIKTTIEDLDKRAVRVAILRPNASIPDARVDEYIKPYEHNWFWQLVFKDWRRYSDVMIASLIANILALSTMIFSMQVYDRVIPAQSVPTLLVLFCGVFIALMIEFCMRLFRIHLTDRIGKRADMRISDKVFGRALRIRSDAQFSSTGSFIAQIKELEQVRELITSSALGALMDMPFFLLFLVVLWSIGGWIAFIPLGVLPLLLIPGLLAQRPLKKLSTEGMRESSIKNAMLVEVSQGMDDIKLMRAEAGFQNQWNHLTEVSASISMKQRLLTGALISWTQSLQSLVFVGVIFVGCFLVMEGDITTGVLIGTSILSSRMIAPIAQISGILARFQQAKIAKDGLDEMMKKPIDYPENKKFFHRPVIQGNYQLNAVAYKYGETDIKNVLEIANLEIKSGERIAILGRNGAGKSTLLSLLSGLSRPTYGHTILDELNMATIDPYDVRRDIGYLKQNSTLFYGSVRDNILMGRPNATDQELLDALKLSGALELVQQLPDGLDYALFEGGKRLSGGQKQLLLLARMLLQQPKVLLLDEPTAALDDVSEHNVITNLEPWLSGRTLIVATHRPAILKWVDRIIILDKGKIVLDDKKDKVLQHIRSQAQSKS